MCGKLDAFIYQKLLNMDKNKKSKDRMLEPAFAVYSSYSTSAFGVQIYDHNFNLIRRLKGIYSGELSSSWFQKTSANVGTSNVRVQATPSNSILGNHKLSVGIDGSMHSRDDTLSSQLTVGTWVNNTTPDYTIHIDDDEAGNTLAWIAPKSYLSTKEFSTHGEASTLNGVNTPLGEVPKVGTISYNEKTKSLAIVESNDTFDQRVIVWKNVEAPSNFKLNDEFFGQLNTDNLVGISPWFTGKPYTKDIEDKERGVVVLLDNGNVVVTKQVPSNGVYSIEYTLNSNGGYDIPTSTIWDAKWSTTYGSNNGTRYGIRHNISNSGKIVIAYAAAYYYGSGYYMTITNVETGVTLKSSLNDSAQGYSFIPLRDDDFFVGKSLNANGGMGAQFQRIIANKIFTPTALTGDTFELASGIAKQLETNYTSTDYPAFVPILGANLYKFIGE